jgi:hypothetical protein
MAATKLEIQELRSYLDTSDNHDLIEEIVFLAKNFPKVKEYYSVKIKEENKEKILKKYKEKIKNEFFPVKGEPKFRSSVMRKLISDFKVISDSNKETIDLKLSFIEYGLEFTHKYGVMDISFYNKLIDIFDEALNNIIDMECKDYFFNRCKKIVENSANIGWGFTYNMEELFEDYYRTN